MINSVLTIEGLSKSFNGIKAVDNLTISVPAAKISALIGPNGSGKTTVFNLISGLLKADSGKIEMSRTNLISLPPHKIARMGVGRTFQVVRLCAQLTVIENVLLAFHFNDGERLIPTLILHHRVKREEAENRHRAFECLRLVGMDGKAYALGNELSHGQRRLVEMARALALNPKLLLLDEPMSGLSPSSVDQVKDIIAKLRIRGITVLFIDHDMEVVSDISENVIVLNYGRKIAEGALDIISTNPEVRAAYLGSSFRASRSR